jgi:hypothetical protein
MIIVKDISKRHDHEEFKIVLVGEQFLETFDISLVVKGLRRRS